MAAVIGNGSFTINEWRVDPSLNRITRGEDIVKVDPQNMKVLELLASRPGEVFSQAQIEQSAWPDVVVTPNSVYQSIANLRRAFGDDKHNPKYIETIARKGYRCIARVELPTAQRPRESEEIEQAMGPTVRSSLVVRAIAIGAATVCTIAAAIFGFSLISDHTSSEGGAVNEYQARAPHPRLPASRLSRAQQAVELGDAAAEARDMASALRHYQIAIDEAEGIYANTDTFFASVYTKRAWIFQAQDEMDRALREAEAAIQILGKNGVLTNPLFIPARSVYAETLLSYGRYVEAEEQANEALRVAIAVYGPDDLHVALARASVARVKLLVGDWENAEDLLRKVLLHFSSRISSFDESEGLYKTLLATALYHQRRTEEAAKEARSALRALENSVEYGLSASAYQVLADALIREGDIAGADIAIGKCLKILRDLAAAPWRVARAESTRAEISIRRGDFEDAKAKLVNAATVLKSERDRFAEFAYAETERRLGLLEQAQKIDPEARARSHYADHEGAS